MSDEATITLTDLARLAGVGRNAVSNWRRRESDFPSPVDDAAHRPRFALADIEAWAREHGRHLDISPADRLWFSLRHASAEHDLQAVAGALDGRGDPELTARLADLTAAAPASDVFEFFVERARESAGTGAPTGTGALVDIAAACAPDRDDLAACDPACGDGDLLTALLTAVPGITAVGAGDLNPAPAAVCEQRLRLTRPDAAVTVTTGDSLLEPLGHERYDLVVCDPPFNVKDWGHDRLAAAGDARSTFGTPPRTEPELAWALHCQALLTDDGVAIVRMPAQAAHRRSGRRLRSELLRWGALRAVVDHPDAKAHIWVLTSRGEASQLLASNGPGLAAAWRTLADDPEATLPAGPTTAVPLMRLWDEDVDISPAVYLAAAEADTESIDDRLARLTEHLDRARAGLPRLEPDRGRSAPETSLAELERGGLAVVGVGPGDQATEGVIVAPHGTRAVRIGPVDGANETEWTVTCRTDALDPGWLAAVLAARLPTATRRTTTGVKRRLLGVKIPRLPVEEQRRRGSAFTEILRLRQALDAARDEGDALADDAAAGLVEGTLTPADQAR